MAEVVYRIDVPSEKLAAFDSAIKSVVAFAKTIFDLSEAECYVVVDRNEAEPLNPWRIRLYENKAHHDESPDDPYVETGPTNDSGRDDE